MIRTELSQRQEHSQLSQVNLYCKILITLPSIIAMHGKKEWKKLCILARVFQLKPNEPYDAANRTLGFEYTFEFK